MQARQMFVAVCLAVALAGGLVVFSPTDWCQADWVRNSYFWSWYFGCSPDYPAVNEPA